jgi:OmpA-OmpF porin, OOP family
MMKRILPVFILIGLVNLANGQGSTANTTMNAVTPKHKWEIGVHGGHMFSAGDLKYKPGFAGGLHVRRALDYVFSLRGDFTFGQMQGGDDVTSYNPAGFAGDTGGWVNFADGTTAGAFSKFKTTLMGGSVQGIISLNNLKWTTATKRWLNPYILLGAGGYNVETQVNQTLTGTTYKEISLPGNRATTSFIATGEVGAGLGLRLTDNFNIAIEHKVMFLTGKRADLVDGFNNRWRDIPNYTNIRLNYNIGGKDKSAPLYWVNPMAGVMADLSELKARPVLDLTDTDGDGVIDMMDKEKDTPSGAPVNTLGVALDSDMDGIIDQKDKEPYSPVGYKVNADGVAQVPVKPTISEADVNRIVDAKLKDYSPKGGGSGEWFLPMINFDLDRYNIKTSEFDKLRNVATVLQKNPSIKIVAAGFTDKSAGDAYNNVLSFNRAQAAIDHLVNVYKIDRSRLVLNFGGEEDNLVPSSGVNRMNRRVEFKVASTETDAGRPSGPNAGKGGKGNRNAGY